MKQVLWGGGNRIKEENKQYRGMENEKVAG